MDIECDERWREYVVGERETERDRVRQRISVAFLNLLGKTTQALCTIPMGYL